VITSKKYETILNLLTNDNSMIDYQERYNRLSVLYTNILIENEQLKFDLSQLSETKSGQKKQN
jgi:hypothetical protein